MATSPRIFSLSCSVVDFGPVTPGQKPVRTIALRSLQGKPLNIVCRTSQPWLQVSLGKQFGPEMQLRVSADTTQMSGSGPQSAELEVEALGVVERLTVTATLGTGAPSSAPSGGKTTASSSGPPKASPIPTAVLIKALQHASRGLSLSYLAALLVNSALLGTIFSACMTGSQPGGGVQKEAVFTALVLAGLYYGVAFSRLFLGGATRVPAGSSHPAHQRLFRVLGDVCRKAKVAVPQVNLKPDPKPNLVSYGVSPRYACLNVNQGLLDTLSDDSELAAALAHEVAHLRRYDTLFFSTTWPIVWAVNALLGLSLKLLASAGKARRGASVSPLAMLMLMPRGKGGAGGCLAALLVLFCLFGLLMALVMYVAMALLGLLCVSVACFQFSRHAEKQADLEAVRLIGDSDALLIAMAKSVDHYPSEMAALEQFASSCLGAGKAFAFADVIAALKSGAAVPGAAWRDRAFRSHPSVLQRTANIVAVFGSKIG